MAHRPLLYLTCLALVATFLSTSTGRALPESSPAVTVRVSAAPGVDDRPGDSERVTVSADGRVVVFDSTAPSLVPGDTNNSRDVFAHDLQTGLTTRVSVSSTGIAGNLDSDHPAVSADGRYVAFRSFANNLVSGDTARCLDTPMYDYETSCADIFVHDRQTGKTVRVSVGPSGRQANGSSDYPTMSADGRLVAFISLATNLVTGDTNGVTDIFVHDRATAKTTRVSISTAGAQGNEMSTLPALSADGRWVAFATVANNLFPGDTNRTHDIALRDQVANRTTRIPADLSPNSQSLGPVVSADGSAIVFYSVANNLSPDDTDNKRDIFLYDRPNNEIILVSRGLDGTSANGVSDNAAISGDGRFVVFSSVASNLVPGDTNHYRDVFRYDRLTGAIERVSVGANGEEATGESNTAAASGDGQVVAFTSRASNLVAGDANDGWDAFARQMAGYTVAGIVTLDGAPLPGVALSAGNQRLVTAADGRYTFHNLPPGPISLRPARPGFTFSPDTATTLLPPDASADFAAASPFAAADYFLGAASAGTVGGVAFDAADILAYDEDRGAWQLFFDASRVLAPRNVAAFAFDGPDILLVFAANQSIAGAGTFTPWDVARFSPTALGASTAGSFTWALDGSTAGLTTSGEKIDALAVAPDGRLLISTSGAAAVPGPGGALLKAQDEDVIAFAGGWSLAFDGSTVVGLAAEDVNGLAIEAAGSLTITILGPFNVGGMAGDGKDVLRLTPSAAGYTVSRLWDGSAAPFPAQLDALEMAR